MLSFPLHAAFLALPLEGAPKWQFQALQEALKPYEDSLRFQNPQSPHLTLQYWPELMEIEYHQILKQAEKIASSHHPLTLTIIGADTFGLPSYANSRRPVPARHRSGGRSGTGGQGYDRQEASAGRRGEDRVLFLTIAFSDELARIKKSCPWPSLEPFSPHITLARMRHPQRFATVKKKVMKELHEVTFPIPMDRLRLYAEVNGVKQTPLRDFMLS